MSTPKRHHFIPQLVLRNFTDSRGYLHFFDRRIAAKGVLAAAPGDIFFEKHLYSQVDKEGHKDVSLERELSVLEGNSGPVLRKIIDAARAGRLPRLSTDETVQWNEFFYYQWKRTPDIFQRTKAGADLDGAVARAVVEFEEKFRPLTDKERADTKDPAILKRVQQNAKVKAVAAPSSQVMDVLAKMGLAIMAIPPSAGSFLIGSDPIAKLGTPGQKDLGSERVEAWFPIAFDVAVSPAPWAAPEERLLEATPEQTDRINVAIFKNSTLVAAPSPEIVMAIVKRVL